MAGYSDTRQMIVDCLLGRTEGTEIQPEKHQAYALNMLEYIRSLELISSSPIIGIAKENTTPVQPSDSRVCYIASIPPNTEIIFTNFLDNNGLPVTISTSEAESNLVILLWNTQYWSPVIIPILNAVLAQTTGQSTVMSMSQKAISDELQRLLELIQAGGGGGNSLGEYNVSLNFPTGGINGTNIYTFDTAILKVPTVLRQPTLKVVFLAEVSGEPKTQVWVYNGGTGVYTLQSNWSDLVPKDNWDEIEKKINDALQKLQEQIQEQMNELNAQIDEKIEEAVNNRVTPILISATERKVGTYNFGGEQTDIYEMSVQLPSLPKTEGETKEYVISDEPLGFGLYFNVESFIASTGSGLNKEFFQFNYEVTRFYINENLQSCMVVKCKNAVTQDVYGLLHLQYCKFFGDEVEFDVTVPEGVDKDAISLEIPPLKFNKKMVFSYITDDSYSIFQYIFSFINKRYIAKVFKYPDGRTLTWHLGMQDKPNLVQYVSEAFYPENFCQCTDGAGVKRRYATTVSTWPDKLKDREIGQDVDQMWPWMSEKEFKFYFDFGFMVGYHDLQGYNIATTNTQEEFNKCVETTANLFKSYVDIIPKLMVEPNGDHKYITFSRGNDIIQVITAQAGDPSIKKVYPFQPDFTLNKNQVSIERLFAYGSDLNDTNEDPQYSKDLMSILDGFDKAADKSTIYWLIGSAHRSAYWESYLFKKIHDAYGDVGNDSLWFPTLDEMFEYWYMRENTLTSKTITSTGVHFKLFVPKGANFFFRDLSVLLSGITSMDGVKVTSGDNVYGTSYAINDGKLLVNLNFNSLLMDRVNKYVEAFEADPNKEYAYDNAYYFVQMLKEGVKEPYLARLNKFTSPPVLESFTINSGAETTQDQTVILNMGYSGQAPTHYIASENSDFTGAEWKEWVLNPSFQLSDGYTEKTIYVKLKNIYGESTTLSDSITYLEPALTLTSIEIDGGASSTTQAQVNVKFYYTGFPTHYMISESASFESGVWVDFVETAPYQLSSAFGDKTLYAKLKNAVGETSVKTSSIEYIDTVTARLNSITINDGAEATNSGTVSVKFDTANTITKYKIGKMANLSDCPDWIPWVGSTVQFESGVTEGLLTVYAQVGNEHNDSQIKSDSINVVLPVVLGGMKLAGGESSFVGYNVPVAFTVTSGTPTHYRLAETTAGLSSAAWIAWKSNIIYSFASLGNKTLYGQVKNAVSESSVVNASITLTEPMVTALVGFNGASNQKIDFTEVNGTTFNQVRPAMYAGWNNPQMKDTQGNLLSWKFNCDASKYAENSVFQSGINNYSSNSSADDTGVYPVAQFILCQQCFTNNAENTKKLRLSFNLPAGTYKLRFLYSPADAFLIENAYRDKAVYAVFKGTDNLAQVPVSSDSGFTGKANNDFNAELTFTLSETSDIDVAAWLEGATKQFRPGYNLLEFTKLA